MTYLKAGCTYLFLLSTLLVTSGCIGLFLDEYGSVERDSIKVRQDGQPVYIPHNARTVSQGFKPDVKHNGIDIYGRKATPVLAPAPGEVIESYYEPFYGNHLTIFHGRDRNGMYVKSRYFHLEERLVKVGDRVSRGQQIGILGRTGLLAGYHHLHFEIRSGDSPETMSEPENPHRYWADGVGIVTCFDRNREWIDSVFQLTYPVPCRGVEWRE